LKNVIIYTDGACSGNPGPGGWGAILRYGEHKRELSGGDRDTTNNRMELTGVIKALETLREPCTVELYTDSRYICDAINKGWLDKWVRLNFKRSQSAGSEVKNPDLWQRLLPLLKTHSVTFHWVKGHAENEYNNRCDVLAVLAAKQFK